MRLDRVYIDGFKNLKQLSADFDERQLTTVIIGQNGAGKSNLIEAITSIFRWVDLRRNAPRFHYRVDYRIDGARVALSNLADEPAIAVDQKEVSRAEFERRKTEWFPDLVFGYYSGSSRRLEALFDDHQRRYYDAIKLEASDEACARAQAERRLFYGRPIHGILALLAFFAFPDAKVKAELASKLGIKGFHSMLTLFREPWYAKGSRNQKIQDAHDFWGATGPAGRTARTLQTAAFHPIRLVGNSIDDYRNKQQIEAQYATFLPALANLQKFGSAFKGESEMFYALEAMDISDLIRTVDLWVTRSNDISGDVGFADLSDGERQLLMALGLIRVSRGKRALFLLDEPDTHLNPHWQHSYLKLIEDWTGIAADAANCHIILTSHNPLTISALTREEVRVMTVETDGRISVLPPYTDPKGMGFTATLTEIFGLATSLDIETQRLIDERNALAQLLQKSDPEERRLIEINDQLARLGFLFEDREPLYQDFLRAWHSIRYADRPPLTASDVDVRQNAMKALIKQLMAQEAKP
ncbi:MAG: hemin importer ATP-binding subunit [Candidatus Accumulibacter appositus]|uniref:Hemin importer ATP-binding subunit n=1 Tax=Candidatus Accumulibacter appositus TaxID=1454003 RepID=A0A011NYE5_9PROT|nr:AAA family ATPase [Accumulibacter sp.]EXI80341.1 MAG: hemin importer ATP-binding subunit [Candidatus Accumulibacter appositus]HRF03091.1 AAA family ATPase [Accumulibacter sp.]